MSISKLCKYVSASLWVHLVFQMCIKLQLFGSHSTGITDIKIAQKCKTGQTAESVRYLLILPNISVKTKLNFIRG